ncbi:MAG: TonB family protein [Cycloclasticus sp.]|nr:TonB family protein [Cycloclasticus sp.]
MTATTVTSSDKLSLTLFAAAIIHTLIILGISFQVAPPRSLGKKLEVVLIQNPDVQRPDEADFLAQEDQIGSGEGKEKKINQQQASISPQLKKRLGDAQKTQPTASSPQTVLLQNEARRAIDASPKKAPNSKAITTAELLQKSQEIAQSQAEITATQNSISGWPRRSYINSISAHKHIAASYESAWQQKVEKIGNLNYPGEARRKKLSGTLVLTVELYSDGTLRKTTINRRSGHKIIDDAAVNIVKLASPFSPFPLNLQREADILVITRTWQFQNSGQLRALQ